MKILSVLLIFCLLCAAPFSLLAQTPPANPNKTMSCPAICPAQCKFLVNVVFGPKPDTCYTTVTVNLQYGSTSPPCKADIDRESQVGSGNITYTTCSGEKCKLTAKNFPDNSPIPIGPGDSVPPGKQALTKGCRDAITVTPAPPGVGGGAYVFSNVKDLMANFTMKLYCFCGADTTKDTIRIQNNVAMVAIEHPPGDGDLIDRNGDGIIDERDMDNDDTDGSMLRQAITIYNAMDEVEIKKLYPNPFRNTFRILLESATAQVLQFTIMDNASNVVFVGVKRVEKGIADIPVELENTLPDGTYYLQIHQENGKFSTTRLEVRH